MLGAAGVQIKRINLDNLHFSKRKDGTSDNYGITKYGLGLGVSFSRSVGFLRGTLVVVAILVKGHAFPTIVKVRLVGYDPLALVDRFTLVEDNIGLLETRFEVEVAFVIVFPEDVTGLVNLTLLSLFVGVTTTNFPLALLILGHVLLMFVSNS
ncbi:hypothetical protein Tco_1533893 [Tanacetum coccineum]